MAGVTVAISFWLPRGPGRPGARARSVNGEGTGRGKVTCRVKERLCTSRLIAYNLLVLLCVTQFEMT